MGVDLISCRGKMHIKKVCAEIYRIPVHRKMEDAIRHFSKMDIIFANVETDEGLVGTGFTYSIIPFGAGEICSMINHGLGPLIHQMDPRDHEQIWSHMWRQVDWVGSRRYRCISSCGSRHCNLGPEIQDRQPAPVSTVGRRTQTRSGVQYGWRLA